ncbi:Cof-type HAD-IIB family hydrolase [Croceiramulus getboli]|nr:Cof-type HAD-IIB family hydrolase [Flavobacteriaceae bacterium YJPT1-3]
MKYRLICTDIDGTLLNAERYVSNATIKSIRESQLPVILASSRMPSAMRYLQEPLGMLDHPMICYNGGLILGFNGKRMASHAMPDAVLDFLLHHPQRAKINCSVYCEDQWYTGAKDQWTLREMNNTRVDPTLVDYHDLHPLIEAQGIGIHKIMCMGDSVSLDAIVAGVLESFRESVHCYRSKDTYLEISASGITKSAALKLLLERELEMKMEEVIAFGDNHNDVELIRDAGWGVAVANATPDVVAVADHHAPYTNKEDAVALTLAEILNF